MSQPIASSSLANPVVGGVGFMDWSGNGLPVTGGKPAQIVLQNESGCGLRVKLRGSGRGFDMPAGAWFNAPLPLLPNETGLDWTIVYVLANQPVGLLLGTYYAPGEAATGMSLGNSPIGLSGSVSTVNTQVINDGNAAGTQFVEATYNGNTLGSNVSIDNSGNMALTENFLGTLYNLLKTSAGVGVGGDVVQLGSSRATWTHVLSQFKVDQQSSFDGGKLTTNGSGTVTLTGELNATTAATDPPLSLFMPTVPLSTQGLFSGRVTGDSASRVGFQVRSDGYGQIILGNAGGTSWHLWGSGAGLNMDAPLATVANISTVGYGAPLIVAMTKDLSVTSTATTTVVTYTTPNDGANHFVRAGAGLFVGGGNTNNGVVTLEVTATDPNQGAITLVYNVYGQTNLISGITQAKGAGIRTDVRDFYCSPNTAVTVVYKNAAAGTISDKVWGYIELVG